MKTKQVTIAAALTALNLLYIWLMPTIDLQLWSFTPFSHMPLIIGVFISPYVGIMTCIGTLLGFMLKTSNYIIWLRASSHIVFIFALILVLKTQKIDSFKKLVFLNIFVAIIHAALEILAIFIGVWIGIPFPQTQMTAYFILIVAGLGTFGHSILDFFVAFIFTKTLKRAHLFFSGYGPDKGLQLL